MSQNSPPRYIYQRHGQPLLSWANGPPSQSRAADAKSLGDYTSPPGNPMGLPRGGAPEFLGGLPKRLMMGAYGDGTVPSSNPPIRQRGIGNYIAVGDDAVPVPGTIPSAAQTAFDTYKRPVASALAAYHGVKRTGSVGWAIMYAVLGYVAPVTTTAVSLAQGFSEKKQ